MKARQKYSISSCIHAGQNKKDERSSDFTLKVCSKVYYFYFKIVLFVDLTEIDYNNNLCFVGLAGR